LTCLGTVVEHAGDIDKAVDFLFTINYLGPPTSDKDVRFLRSLTSGLEQYKINRPEGILMDPKLFGPFMICYGEDDFNLESLNSSFSQQDFMNYSLLGQNIYPPYDRLLEHYDKVTSFTNTGEHHGQAVFRERYGQAAIQVLWLWQCQNFVLSRFRTSVAMEVEFIYNYIRLMYASLWEHPQKDMSDMSNKFVNESSNVYGERVLDARLFPFEQWRFLLSGFWCVVAAQLQFNPSEFSQPSCSLWKKFEQEYRLYQPRTPTQLSSDDLDEFDAAFICSGPFKFQLTDNICNHLKFKENDSLTILLYYDRGPCPGSTGRGCIFEGNIFAAGFSFVMSRMLITRQFKLDKWQNEVSLSYRLLFGQSSGGLKIAQKLFNRPVEPLDPSFYWEVSVPVRSLGVLIDGSNWPEKVYITQWQGNFGLLFKSRLLTKRLLGFHCQSVFSK